MAGSTDSMGAGGNDIYLLWCNSSGQLFWQKAIGEGGEDRASCVQKTSDGGYIIAGWTDSLGHGGQDCLLVKTDASGNLLWRKTFGDTSDDRAYRVRQTSDGGYIVAGWTIPGGEESARAYIFKTNASGGLLWEQVYSMGMENWAYDVLECQDGGYLVVGCADCSNVNCAKGIYLAKTKADGSLETHMHSGLDKDEVAYSVRQTSDGGYIIAGWTESYGSGGIDFFLQKYDSSLNLKIFEIYGGTGDDVAYSVQQTSDGGYILAGWTESFGAGGKDVYLVKTDSTGTSI